EIYKEYSEWLFSILEKLESELNFSSYSNVERRVIGHIAERLLGVYIYKKREEGVLKIKELRRTLVKNVDCNINYPTPSFLDESTPIVLNFNNNYAKVAGALIQSITEFSSSKKNYDFFVLGNNIDEGNKEKLELIIKPYKNMRISYIDMNKFNLFDNLHVSGHFSKETYYRLYIPKIFSNFEKVIYIDADMIVQKDLNDLIQIDLDGKPIAAVQCYIMQLMINNKVLSSYESGSMPADLYVKNYLNLDRGEDYFQAGLLVMDIEKLRRLDFVNKAEKLILEQNFWFLDQDIMNCILNGNVKFIEYNWNTLHGNEIENNLEKILPIQYRSLYLDAKNEPYIIHYAGENKPWINRYVYFSNIWWAYFTKTGWYTSEVLLRLEQLETSPHIKYGNSVFIKIGNNLIKVINKIFPVGSKRRVFLVKQYRYIRQNIK
ncbi:glycosyltransferase, partial [Photobacterium damselae]